MRRHTGDHRRQHQGSHGAVGSLAVHIACGLGIVLVLLGETMHLSNVGCSYAYQGRWQHGRQDLCELWRFVLPPQQGLWCNLEQQRGGETAVFEVHAILTASEVWTACWMRLQQLLSLGYLLAACPLIDR